MGPASRLPTWSRGRPWKRSASLRLADLFCGPVVTPAASTALESTLDLGPCGGPVVVVLACITAAVTAVGHRHLPVVDLLPEIRIRCVVLVAELRIRRKSIGLGGGGQGVRIACLALSGCLAEV